MDNSSGGVPAHKRAILFIAHGLWHGAGSLLTSEVSVICSRRFGYLSQFYENRRAAARWPSCHLHLHA